MDRKAYAVRASVDGLFGVEVPDPGEKARHQRPVDSVGAAVVVLAVQAEASGEGFQLPLDVAPFAHLHEREVRLLRKSPELRLRKLGGLRVPPLPELEGPEEVGGRFAELRVRGVGLLAFVHRAPHGVVASHRGDYW